MRMLLGGLLAAVAGGDGDMAVRWPVVAASLLVRPAFAGDKLRLRHGMLVLAPVVAGTGKEGSP